MGEQQKEMRCREVVDGGRMLVAEIQESRDDSRVFLLVFVSELLT